MSKYLLFIGYIQNALTVNFHSIFTIVRSSSAPVTNDRDSACLDRFRRETSSKIALVIFVTL